MYCKIRLEVEHLSKDREAPAVWLWSSKAGDTDAGSGIWKRPTGGRV
ncbi:MULTISPECIES: hypothetical protein [Streptomyces]|uniref:Uncharacterized protein n=1 Tax=Streptomyces chartreusis NRRL 3882 TaxID=1079985 RepID=A0A2N9BLZ5_STRCX|nr:MULTISPECIES: hypothetical protein [Streptomyces]SOR84378.1 hypothetical protein SCNRRL3882_7823 [Streptomyces chartreusis NRRL 3882]